MVTLHISFMDVLRQYSREEPQHFLLAISRSFKQVFSWRYLWILQWTTNVLENHIERCYILLWEFHWSVIYYWPCRLQDTEPLEIMKTQQNRNYDKWYSMRSKLKSLCQLSVSDHILLQLVEARKPPNVHFHVTCFIKVKIMRLNAQLTCVENSSCFIWRTPSKQRLFLLGRFLEF